MTYRKRKCSVKEYIRDAMIELILVEKRVYSQLTIQDIVDQAGVCRNSFYRNFADKDEVFLYWFYWTAEQSGILLETLDGEDFTTNVFISFLETVRTYRDFLLSFYFALPSVYMDTFTDNIMRSNGVSADDNTGAEDYYKSACKAWIVVGLLTEWMKKECDTPIETMACWLRQWCSGLV